MEEIWKDIEGYEGLYQVSSQGKVRSLDRIVTDNRYRRLFRGLELKETATGTGYLSVMLSKNGVTKRFLVHRLVADAFIPNPDNLPEVNHKSEVKTENTVENLEWCDRSYNNTYCGIAAKRQKKRKKPIIQLSHDGIELCYWFSISDCAKETGFKKSSISKCCIGTLKTYMGYRWVFVK